MFHGYPYFVEFETTIFLTPIDKHMDNCKHNDSIIVEHFFLFGCTRSDIRGPW